jgi:hypothetical protein
MDGARHYAMTVSRVGPAGAGKLSLSAGAGTGRGFLHRSADTRRPPRRRGRDAAGGDFCENRRIQSWQVPTHMRNGLYDALVQSVYSGALEPQPWQTFLQTYRRHLRSNDIGIEIHLPRLAGLPIQLRDSEVDAEFAVQYRQSFVQEDPWRSYVMHSGDVVTFDQVIDMRRLRRTHFFREFMCRHGALYGMKATIASDGITASVIAGRTRQQGNFSARDISECRRLLPHLQQALRHYHALALAEIKADSYFQLLRQQHQLVLWLDADGCVLPWHAPESLQAFAPFVQLSAGRLKLLEADTDQLLQRLIGWALRAAPVAGGEQVIGSVGLAWSRRDGRSLLVKACNPGGRLRAAAPRAVICMRASRASAALSSNTSAINAADATGVSLPARMQITARGAAARRRPPGLHAFTNRLRPSRRLQASPTEPITCSPPATGAARNARPIKRCSN